ncbi:MAG: histidinol-phosphatase HisJ family protein [Firmicutes bacterium]|nr:histidinol-phosphatase HisJ family protein [Bacillota bacterium]
MQLYDYHVHSDISFDGRLPLAEVCRLALQAGAAGLTFTEHVEFTGPGRPNHIPDFPLYAARIEEAREAFPQLTIGMGLEIGLYPGYKSEIEEIVNGSDWDFILGSLHNVDGLGVYNEDFIRGKNKTDAYHRYFEAMYELFEAYPCFDVAGHLDMIRRNRGFADRTLRYQDYAGELDAILKLLIQRGQGLEINTAGWRFGVGGAHPDPAILRRYKELGGQLVTCGSDSHGEKVLDHIAQGYDWLLDNGFHRLTLYRQRQPYFLDISR